MKAVHDAIWVEYKSDSDVKLYIEKWHESYNYINCWEYFNIVSTHNKIDLLQTLHNMKGETLLKVAIDLGVETPDFIPSIPVFKNELKADFKTAYDTFTKAFKQIEENPSSAIGFANSALESIIKEILKDERLSSKTTGKETLYKLALIILKEFKLTSVENPNDIKKIGNSLVSIAQSIENLRSEKTDFHGKTEGDYIIKDSIYAYLVVNSVTTVGLFLNAYYINNFPKPKPKADFNLDDLPF